MDKNDLTLHPSTEIVDASKLKTYTDCPRKYFKEHVLGWRLEGPNVNLVFGECWHRCMEHLLIHGYNIEAIQEAAAIGEEYYREFYPPSSDALNGAKVPGILPIALAEYVGRYKSDNFEVLHTEVGGAVPIDDKRVLHFRLDSIMKDNNRHGKIVSLEHKTSKRRGYFENYAIDLQSGTYTHVLYCAYPAEEVYGVEINGAVFLKKERDFQRVPAARSPDAMLEWLWSVQHWYDRLDWDYAELNECSEGDKVMSAFVKNTQACSKYGKCTFYDICHARANPLQFPEAPPGYEIEFWDPREREVKSTLGSDGEIVKVKKAEGNELKEAPNYLVQRMSPIERARTKIAASESTGVKL